jgi:hypothetical protein
MPPEVLELVLYSILGILLKVYLGKAFDLDMLVEISEHKYTVQNLALMELSVLRVLSF